jgi:two-component system KDP operon response regulator KdpE
MHGANILVVDDEMIVRRVIGDALAGAGYQVVPAADAPTALQMLQQHTIDLILLDLQLGDSSGIDLLKQIRQLNEFVPVIILTAHGSLPSAIEAVRQAVSDYLLKPVRMEVLRQRVTEVLAANQLRHNREHRIKAMYENLQALMQEEGMIDAETAPSHQSGASSTQSRRIYEVKPLVIDVAQHLVRMRGDIIDVTPTEFAILLELVRQPGAVVSCARLVSASQDIELDEEEARQVMRPHIVRLRRKIESDAQSPVYIQSVRGLGYRWGEPH